MKSIQIEKFGGPEVLVYKDVEIKKPGPKEVLIKNLSIGLNFIDVYHRTGLYPIPLPSGIGLEACGVIEEVGSEVNLFKVGDRVTHASMPIGAYSEKQIMPEEKLVSVPDGVSDEVASCITLKGITAEYLLHRAYPLKKGDKVLYHAAAGGLGQILCPWANALGAQVIGTVGSKAKEEIAKKNGCHHVINYTEKNFVEEVEKIVGKNSIDVVYDGVGIKTFKGSIETLKIRGMMVAFGNASGYVDTIDVKKDINAKGLFFTRPSIAHYTVTREELVESAKKVFDAILSAKFKVDISKKYSLQDSEKDGSLRYVGSVLTKNDKQLRHSLAFEGTRAITFAHILKWKTFPLTAIATELLKLGKKSLGCEVEIEFSVNLYKDKKPNFNILQIKPMSNIMVDLENKSLEKDSIFSRSNHSLGNGSFNDLRDLIIVRDETFLITKSHEIAREIASLNKRFSKSEHYIICGPGRWGSTDHWMGIPVTWDQISRAKVFIEVGRDDLPIEPSFGSHFFQNITSLNKGYFTIDQKSKSDFMNYEWLSENDIVKKYDYIDHYKFSEPLIVRIDGTSGLGIIQKPSNRYNQLMDESKSSGI